MVPPSVVGVAVAPGPSSVFVGVGVAGGEVAVAEGVGTGVGIAGGEVAVAEGVGTGVCMGVEVGVGSAPSQAARTRTNTPTIISNALITRILYDTGAI